MDKGKHPKEHIIEITVEDGDFTYDNPIIWVDPGDIIKWECTNHWPFAIHVGWDSPLKKGRFRSVNGNSIKTIVPDEARPGNYEYAIAVVDEKTREIWIDHPPFIVKRPPGG